jgi:hypothetical protein
MATVQVIAAIKGPMRIFIIDSLNNYVDTRRVCAPFQSFRFALCPGSSELTAERLAGPQTLRSDAADQ